MHLIMVVSPIALTAIAFLATYYFVKRSKRLLKDEELRFVALTNAAIGGDCPERQSLLRLPSLNLHVAIESLGFRRLSKSYSYVAEVTFQNFKARLIDERQANRFAEKMEEWRSAKRPPFEQLFNLAQSLGEPLRNIKDHEIKDRVVRETGYNFEEIYSRLLRAFNAECRRLRTKARTDYDAFLDLRRFLRDYVKAVGGSYPDEWYQLVAHHLPTPRLSDFGIESTWHVRPGELQRMAADALRTSDLIDAKLVLAYVNSSDHHYRTSYREAVGPVLAAEITKLVSELDAAKVHMDA